ncbi:hypothetical protein [Pigmentiphaga litoralis]|uniref:hypothetical protein n=1 Tax=Pigmentiphaga litoralis TaxID=516702 RepID=UPI0016742025|nr:hypothetical protein [Pigmentiphaga litoralis]
MNVNVRWWGMLLVCLALPVNAQNVTPADRADSGSTAPVTTPAETPAPAPVLAPPPSPSPEPLATKADVDARLDRLYGAHQPYADFLVALQKASAANDRQAIANMVHYPFSTLLAARRKVLKTPKAFLARYDDIMTPKVRAAIAAQTYETLFSNSNGLMIGSGQVWFTGKCVDATCAKPPRIGISAINH